MSVMEGVSVTVSVNETISGNVGAAQQCVRKAPGGLSGGSRSSHRSVTPSVTRADPVIIRVQRRVLEVTRNLSGKGRCNQGTGAPSVIIAVHVVVHGAGERTGRRAFVDGLRRRLWGILESQSRSVPAASGGLRAAPRCTTKDRRAAAAKARRAGGAIEESIHPDGWASPTT